MQLFSPVSEDYADKVRAIFLTSQVSKDYVDKVRAIFVTSSKEHVD
jgi:hypothetical protein